MKAAETKAFKATLEAMRARLRGDVTTMADAALRKTRSEASGDLSSMPIHMADIGSDAYEQEFTLSLMACEEGTLEQIEQAPNLGGITTPYAGQFPILLLNSSSLPMIFYRSWENWVRYFSRESS